MPMIYIRMVVFQAPRSPPCQDNSGTVEVDEFIGPLSRWAHVPGHKFFSVIFSEKNSNGLVVWNTISYWFIGMINHEFGNGKHIPPILIYLVGGDWNHGMDYDFPETVGNN